MPRIDEVLVIGSGLIIVGQAAWCLDTKYEGGLCAQAQ